MSFIRASRVLLDAHDRVGRPRSRANFLRCREIKYWTCAPAAALGRPPEFLRLRRVVRQPSCGPGGGGSSKSIAHTVSYAINLATNYAAGAGKASRSGPCDDVRCYAGDVLAQRGPEHGFHGIEGLQFSNVIPLLITIRSASTTDAVPRRYAQRWRPPCSGRSTRQVAFLWSPRCRANSAAAWRNAASRQG